MASWTITEATISGCSALHSGEVVMVDPVVASCCGESFERTAAEARAAATGTCAFCGARLAAVALVPNRSLCGTLALMKCDAMRVDMTG